VRLRETRGTVGTTGEIPTAGNVTEHASPRAFGLGPRCGAIDQDVDVGAIHDPQAWERWLHVASECPRNTGARDDRPRSRGVAHVHHRQEGLRYAVGHALGN
jgi:hypothetical protein